MDWGGTCKARAYLLSRNWIPVSLSLVSDEWNSAALLCFEILQYKKGFHSDLKICLFFLHASSHRCVIKMDHIYILLDYIYLPRASSVLTAVFCLCLNLCAHI